MDVAGEEDEFQAVITSALNVLLLGLEARLEASLTQMARISWSSLDSVSFQVALPPHPPSCSSEKSCLGMKAAGVVSPSRSLLSVSGFLGKKQAGS